MGRCKMPAGRRRCGTFASDVEQEVEMSSIQTYLRPSSVDQALSMLAEHKERARPLAGGTSLILSRSPNVEVLVDLADVGLDGVDYKDEGVLEIGAMTSCSHLSAELRKRELDGGALGEAVSTLYTPVLRNHITVGGNCVMVYGWSHLPLAMWALGASFVLQSDGGETREVDADTFFEQHPLRGMECCELLVRIKVAAPEPAGRGSAYLKFGRDKSDEGIASVCVSLQLAEGKISAARIIVGRTRPMPQKLDEVAALLVGRAPEAEAFAEAAEAAAKAVVASDNYLGSAEYRRDVVASLVRDTLAKAAARAGGAA